MLLRPSSINQIDLNAYPIFPLENLLSWWFAGNGLEQDPTITGSNNNPVTMWGDKSGNGYNLTQTGAGSSTYRVSDPIFNNRGSVAYDGAVYHLRNISPGILAVQPVYSHYVVMSSLAAAQNVIYCEGNNGSILPFIITRIVNAAGLGGHTYRGDTSFPEAQLQAGDVNNGSAHLITALKIAQDRWQIRIDGGAAVAISITQPTVPTITRLAIGALVRTTVSTFFTGKVATILSYSEINYTVLEPILKAYYGIP